MIHKFSYRESDGTQDQTKPYELKEAESVP